jgi:hypothetical protein
MTQKISRRDMLLTGFGAGSLLSAGVFLGCGMLDREKKATNGSPDENGNDCWQYAKIDPAKAADLAYEIYSHNACMYAPVRALITTVADVRRFTAPTSATMMMDFPFHMMRYGYAGIATTGSTCGAINGAAAVIGLFVKDAAKADAMIVELCLYYEQTELPIYKPKNDEFPEMITVKPESVLCHISSGRWRAAADVAMLSSQRFNRCRRLVADIVLKTAELLNRYHADNACTFAAPSQPTATCFHCHVHSPMGQETGIIVKMNCASCHQQGESHFQEHGL